MRILQLTICLLFFTQLLFAQNNPKFDCWTEHKVISQNSSVTVNYQFSFDGYERQNLSEFEPPQFKNAVQIHQGQASKIANNKYSKTYSYNLQYQDTGLVIIPAASYIYKGDTLACPEIEIKVVEQDNSQPFSSFENSDQLFFVLELDTSTLRIGAVSKVQLVAYSQLNIDYMNYIEEPSIEGNFLSAIDHKYSYPYSRIELNQKVYRRYIIQTYEFKPFLSGTFKINTGKVKVSRAQNFFNSTPEEILEIQGPKEITIQAETRLSHISQNLNEIEITENKLEGAQLSFKVKLKGDGNLIYYLPPDLELGDKATVKSAFLSQSKKSEPQEKLFKYTVEFHQNGKYPIQLKWVGWNTNKQRLDTILSNSIVVNVKETAFASPPAPKNILTSKFDTDIVLVADLSSSMMAKDFSPNRLNAMKKMMRDLVQQKTDRQRIAIVAFAGEAFTICSLSTDSQLLNKAIDLLDVQILEDGTGLNLSLLMALSSLDLENRLQKNIILFTDGVNNISRFGLPHQTISEIACGYGISIQSIGIGSNEKAEGPIAIKPNGEYLFGQVDVNIDEEMLAVISEGTCGSYTRISLEEQTQLNLIQLLSINTKKTDKFPLPPSIISNLLEEVKQEGKRVAQKYMKRLDKK